MRGTNWENYLTEHARGQEKDYLNALKYNTHMLPADPLEKHHRLTDTQKKALARLGITTVRDLLYHFPVRYVTTGEGTSIADAPVGETVVVYGTLSKLKARKAWKSRIPMSEGVLDDGTAKIKLVWMHQPYIAKMLGEGAQVKVSGKLSEKNGSRSIMNPEVERVPEGSSTAGSSLFGKGSESAFFPVYPETRGVTSRWFFHAVQKALASGATETLDDPLPDDVRKRYNLPALKTALVWVHAPKNEVDSVAARKRFAFEEIFFIQLKNALERADADAAPTWDIRVDPAAHTAFVERFPFTPTNAQTKAIENILNDLAGARAMSRLLEGDVGSGKTFVAAATAHAVVTTRPDGKDFGNLQVAYMAPTEILAQQHFESFIEFFKDLPIQIGLITSSGCRKFPSKVRPNSWTDISRAQLLKWVADGTVPILIGTHALIQKSVRFKHLAAVYIDEQHRFGTKQRAELARKTSDKTLRMPHLLSMTATPIPRTLALTIYGDLDLTVLDELPAGRKKIVTKIVKQNERNAAYDTIRSEVIAGRQAYVICPRIDEPDPKKELALRAKSVEAEAKRLKKDIFPEFEIGILHGKMKPKDKDAVMKRFADGSINILVATSVIEVGVNVPNATVILIEGAERFGLSQLHQLRGRVFRSTHQAYCFLFPETKGEVTMQRLKAIEEAANGFELAEKDLALRGAGELYGGKQWGLTDVGMEALRNLKMVEAARDEAKRLAENDATLAKHPLLASELARRDAVHFE